ncbi:MAG TPA: hypothetical protein VFD82_04420 [Planctomycetota bacterium]|nr:hypothetical protein [Planctomycetota bacterium]
MRIQALSTALLAVPILAQANAIPGLDISMYELTDIAFTGRRGLPYPNGEAGFMVGHSWCNGGTVNLPWVSQSGGVMVDQYPRIAFLLAREKDGRMVQITSQGHSKHSPTAFNFSSGPCAPCTASGGGFFFVGCSDTYGSGTNMSQYNLGPNDELNPWLGTWNPQGSYFDRGDPAVSGAQAIDSIRSLTSTQVSAFDSVKNRMVVRESELLTGSTYYAQVQAVVQGEPVGERDNNITNKQVSITGSGGSWSASASGAGMTGSVLTRWQGAHVYTGGNAFDDGRFAVGVKVTGPVAGLWHYEYAVHNIDNFRGGASLRIPVAAGATVQNGGFRDLDTNPLNEWTFALSPTEISFTAAAANSLDWNTIYNFWFDCSIPPGAGTLTIDQARSGTGALNVQILSEAPSGLSFATKFPVGTACGQCTGTFYEYFTMSSLFDLAGRSMTMSLNNGAYTVAETPVAFVPAAGTNLNLAFNTQTFVALPFSLPFPGGTTTQLQVCSSGYVNPGTNTIAVGPAVSTLLAGNPRWAAAWGLLSPVQASGSNVWFDANPTRAILTWNGVPFIAASAPNTFQMQFFPNGTVHVLWQNIALGTMPVLTGWSPGGGFSNPGPRDLSATLPTPYALGALSFDGLSLDTSGAPVLGTTIQWQLGRIPTGTAWGVLMRSLTQAVPPIDLTAVGMPGCYAHVIDPVATAFLSPGTSLLIGESIPNNTALVGVTLVGQAVTYSPPLTPLGLVASNAMVLGLGL